MRILLRPRTPFLALLLLAPSIPELLTGSTPVSELVANPAGFAVGYALDLGLYGTGALVIREFSVILRKGWASILLWGAAYGIAEEGFAVHTFFERSGPPVGQLAVYGSAYGVNWLWALELTVFHATYSIALPVLLTYLWYPTSRDRRWVDRGGLALLAGIYLDEVGSFGLLVGHGPSPAAFLLFLAISLALVGLGATVRGDLLRPKPGPTTVGRWTLGFAGALEWVAWSFVLIVATATRLSAWLAAAAIVVANGAALAILTRRVGALGTQRAAYRFAVGMLLPLFLWDAVVELSIPGILLVAALFAYLLYRLGRTLDRRERGTVPSAAAAGPPSGTS